MGSAEKNRRASRAGLTRAERDTFRAELEQEYGYKPCCGGIREALADRRPEYCHLSIQTMIDAEGDSGRRRIHSGSW